MMMMLRLHSELWSFEALLRFLDIKDVLALACLTREHNRCVVEACRCCTHLDVIESGDVPTVTDRRKFPLLAGFSGMAVKSYMCTADINLLMARWPTWHSLHLSTRMHSRRAVTSVLLKANSTIHFGIEAHTTDDAILRQFAGP